jgi:hypothetical protein
MCVRRSSPNLSTMPVSSSAMIVRWRPSSARMSLSRRSAPRAPRLVDDLLTLEGGEAAQLHREDRVGLDLVDTEQLHEALARLVDRRRAADERDDLVERVERLEVAAQDVHALLGLAQAELRAADDDLDLVLDPVRDEPVERERARHAVDDREHVGAEVLLQLRVLVQVVQHDLGDGIPLEDDDEALARAIARLVADVGDAGDCRRGRGRGSSRDVVGVHLVRQLGDHEARAALDLLDVHDGAHRDRAAAGALRLADALGAEDLRAGGEVGPGMRAMSASSSSSRVASGFSSAQSAPSATSRRLCGGMFVAMPTAMPTEPLTSRFGKRAGRTVGSCVLPS